MHGARGVRQRGWAEERGPRGLPLEIRESRGNIAAAMNTIPLPVIAHAARNTLRSNPRVPVWPSTTLALPFSAALQPRRVVVRDPRLTRARPLFSTRWSFVDAFLFVIPFVIPLPLFVAHRRAPRVADAVIVGPRIAADKTGRGESFNARAGESR